ncbi:MAG: DEAD/DEAH box helicase family protein [Planctomycetaceae bacterium]|nr:DEAD/DEAH box helicase family protein [Planctomycetaceae bacterium]
MSNSIHTETTFETAVIAMLCETGWTEGNAADYSAELALDKKAVLRFIQDSQPEEWKRYVAFYKNESESKFFQRLHRELDLRGMLDVLRRGINDYGIKFQLVFFEPDHSLNPDLVKQCQHNRLIVTRQIHYSEKEPNKSIDLLLSINGLPVATVELKNHFTGQNVQDAIRQYKKRNPRELLFLYKKRTLVHFAVDSDEVYLTTKLDGDQTIFLPFNKGNNGGAGNPINPNGGYRTEYFWREILKPSSWLEIIGRFLHIQKEQIKSGEKIYKREKTLFPRYHQIDVVQKLCNDAKKNNTGKNYLIQHSAGSGKSNSIAWLAYRLSSIYNKKNKRIFDSIIIVTDRNVLDQQLQNTVDQFEHKEGVVQRIDKDSEQLANAIQSGINIIITTLQKFPFALKKMNDIPKRKYAVIIDEAHSSQGGEASKKLLQTLNNVSLDEAERLDAKWEAEQEAKEEESINAAIEEIMISRQQQGNISIFAFTATPKSKTLEVFGTKDSEGKMRPFHLYSMRQAIEEHFILDVLKNYVTYKTYYRFCKQIEEDPELNKRKAMQAIGHFASLHPTNLAQKTEIIIEHFRQITSKQIGGKAKAMVVTSSRKHALRYYLAFKEYIQEKGYEKIIKPLVAYSGSVIDDNYPDGVSESQLNEFGEKELPDKFASDDYQVLLVADKYQTGFDQPLLHTMYVDKKLSGVKAVQTLSRLNRIYPGKEDTFILDFVNERQIIINSFQDYYEQTMMDETTDPNHLYELKNKLDSTNVYYQSEVDAFAKIYYNPGRYGTKEQSRLYHHIDPSIDRYAAKNEEEQDSFKNAMVSFVRLYSFLSQIMPFRDIELEKLYSFSRFLLSKLPKTDYSQRLKLDNDVVLEYYRVQKISDKDLVLEIHGEKSLNPITEAGIDYEKDTVVRLSNIIHILNEQFGTEFTEADRLFFEQIKMDIAAEPEIRERAVSNSLENFSFAVDDLFVNKMIERMEANQETTTKLLENKDLETAVKQAVTQDIYDEFHKEHL